MNERIQLLAEQARTYARYYVAECKCHGYYMEHNELEVRFEKKFAELIVKECLKIVEPTVDSGDEWCVTLKGTAQEIREHFGIE